LLETPDFYRTKVLAILFTSFRHWCLSWNRSIQSTLFNFYKDR